MVRQSKNYCRSAFARRISSTARPTSKPDPMSRGLKLFAQHKDGHEIPVDIRLNPVVTENGTLFWGEPLR
jgi:hypothetical protein